MQIDTSPVFMNLTPASVLSCLVGSTLLTLLAWIILKNNSSLKFVGKYISILLAAVFIRMALPVEFHFTKPFYSKHIMTAIMDFLDFKIGTETYRLSVGQILLALWITGAIFRLLSTVNKYIHFSYIIGRLPGYFKGNIQPIMDRINSELGRQSKFDIRLMPYLETPAIFGIMHPKILMPSTHYTEDELYYILKHEMLHYYHHDMLVKLFCEALCIIYWWNPCVFLLQKMVIKIIEVNVDNSVTCQLDEDGRNSYLKCILKSMRASKKIKADFVITFSGSNVSSIRQRFECILDNYWAARKMRGACITVLSILLFYISISIIFEAEYECNIPGTFDYPTPETSYLIKNGKYYDIYFKGERVGDVLEITGPLTELKIYKEKEILTNEE